MTTACEICGQVCESGREVREHIRRMHEDDACVQCPFCNLAGVSVDEMIAHVHAAHADQSEAPSSPPEPQVVVPVEVGVVDLNEDDDDDDDRLRCPFCDHRENDGAVLQRHVEEEHGEVFELESSFREEPEEEGSPEQAAAVSSSVHECPVCFEHFPCGDTLADHVESHFAENSSQQEATDELIAKELAEAEDRERARRLQAEESELRALRLQYGMDDTGNFASQAESDMQRAVRRGAMSALDYHERRVSVDTKVNVLDAGVRLQPRGILNLIISSRVRRIFF